MGFIFIFKMEKKYPLGNPTCINCKAGLVLQPLNPVRGRAGMGVRKCHSGQGRAAINPNPTHCLAIPTQISYTKKKETGCTITTVFEHVLIFSLDSTSLLIGVIWNTFWSQSSPLTHFYHKAGLDPVQTYLHHVLLFFWPQSATIKGQNM